MDDLTISVTKCIENVLSHLANKGGSNSSKKTNEMHAAIGQILYSNITGFDRDNSFIEDGLTHKNKTLLHKSKTERFAVDGLLSHRGRKIVLLIKANTTSTNNNVDNCKGEISGTYDRVYDLTKGLTNTQIWSFYLQPECHFQPDKFGNYRISHNNRPLDPVNLKNRLCRQNDPKWQDNHVIPITYMPSFAIGRSLISIDQFRDMVRNGEYTIENLGLSHLTEFIKFQNNMEYCLTA